MEKRNLVNALFKNSIVFYKEVSDILKFVKFTISSHSKGKGMVLYHPFFREGELGGDIPLNFPPYSHIQVAARCMVAAVRQTWADGAADTNCVILHKRASGRRNCAKRQELFCYGCQMSRNEETNVTWTSKVP